MVVGVCTIALFLPYAQSLKDKRKIVKGLKDRLRSRHNISIAEIDHQELWQRAGLGIAAVASGRPHLQRIFDDIRNDVEGQVPGGIVDFEVDFL